MITAPNASSILRLLVMDEVSVSLQGGASATASRAVRSQK